MKIKLAKQFKFSQQSTKEPKGLISKILAKNNTNISRYRLSDLYCGELCCVLDMEVNNYLEEGASDITFCLQPLNIGIFTYKPAKFYKYMFVEGDYYTRIIQNKKLVSDNYQANIKIKPLDVIINSQTCSKLIDRFWQEIVECGYDVNSLLSVDEIETLEKRLNEKYKYYMNGTRFVR
ncbi:MAG: hypothetical protein IJA72_05290 [Clostridia bacterium]|nr:hypothetical protein [Clostridia bacterium]